MPKRAAKIDVVPFVPAHSPICRTTETVLVFSVALLCLAGAVTALARQLI